MNALIRLIATFSLSALCLTQAHAVESIGLELRQPAIVHADLVTLGDLFENAGRAAGIAVFRSPGLGTEGTISASRVIAAAREQDLSWTNPENIERVVVKRPSRIITLDAVSDLIRAKAADEDDVGDPAEIDVSLANGAKPIEVEATIEEPVIIRRLDLQRGGGFRAVVGIDGTEIQDRVYSGRAIEMADVPVLKADVERDAVLTKADVELVRMPKERAGAGYVASEDEIVGMAATRTLSGGRPLRSADIQRPTLVRKNTVVEIVYETPGLTLKSQGRALGDGALGESVSVENGQSRRILQAVVREQGTVYVTAGSRASAAAAAAQTSQPIIR